MKKMLDELKKLDAEYKAPADFKDKVMNKIKTIDKEESNSKKTISYNKYVITWVASVAIIILAFVVTIKNDRVDLTKNNSVLDSVITSNQVTADIANIEEIEEISTTDEIVVGDTSDKVRSESVAGGIEMNKAIEPMESLFDSAQEESIFDDASTDYSSEMSVKNSINVANESANEETSTLDTSALKMFNIENEIYNLLIENNIKIIEKEQNYIIIEISLEKAKDIFKDYIDEIKLEEIDENRVKIEF